MSTPKKSSDSYKKIWNAVEKIPRGKVATYGQIARISRLPRQARLVGYALHNLPHGIDIPWQRVINHRGEISFPPNSPSQKKQRELLEKEGIMFLNGKISLKLYGWKK